MYFNLLSDNTASYNFIPSYVGKEIFVVLILLSYIKPQHIREEKMSNNILNIILSGVLLISVFYIIRRIRARYKKTPQVTAANSPAQQSTYATQKPKQPEDTKLSLQEKIELSWAFLTNITEQVLTRFSPRDQEKVQTAGDMLAQNGAQYHHNINSEARSILATVKNVEQNKEQSLER